MPTTVVLRWPLRSSRTWGGDFSKQRVESMDLGLGVRDKGAEGEHRGDNNDDEVDTDVKPAKTGNKGRVDRESKPRRAPQYSPSQEMRLRSSPRAIALAESVDRPQGRSTSIEYHVAQDASQYGEVAAKQELQGQTPVGVAAPIASISSAGLSPEMSGETAARLLDDNVLSSQHQRKDIERSGRRGATSTARQPLQAAAQSQEPAIQAGFSQQDALRPLLDEVAWLPEHSSRDQQPEPETVGLPLLSRLRGFVEGRTRRAFVWESLKQEYALFRVTFSRGLGLGTIVNSSRSGQPSDTESAISMAELNTSEKSSDTPASSLDANAYDQNSAPPRLSNGNVPEGNATAAKVRFLYVYVDLSPPRFIQVDCTNLHNDKDTFDELKSSYDRERKSPRRIFSIWQYHHCEFYLFGKWGVELGGPLKRHSFPPQGDPYYDFRPDMPFPDFPWAPIPPQEFHDRHYLRDRKYWAHDSAGPSTDRAVASQPLRNKELNWENGLHETFYGLLAVEQLCYWRLRLYLALLVALGAVLGSLWAFKWGGRGLEDLQNALTPLQVGLAVWQIVVSM